MKEHNRKFSRMDDRFESAHSWSEVLENKNKVRFAPTEITQEKYEDGLNDEELKQKAVKLLDDLNDIFLEIDFKTLDKTWSEKECIKRLYPIKRLISNIDYGIRKIKSISEYIETQY